MEESQPWLQQQRTLTRSGKWWCGVPTRLSVSRTWSSTMVVLLCCLCTLELFGWSFFSVYPYFTVAVRDVSKWSARMRQPMEEMYGAEVFAKMWEAWVDGISAFTHRPEGRDLLAPAAFLIRIRGEGRLRHNQRESASLHACLLFSFMTRNHKLSQLI